MGRCLFHLQISETCWIGFFPIRVPHLQSSFTQFDLPWFSLRNHFLAFPAAARQTRNWHQFSVLQLSGCLVLYAPWTPTEDLGCSCQVSKQCFGSFLPTSSEPPGSREDKVCRKFDKKLSLHWENHGVECEARSCFRTLFFGGEFSKRSSCFWREGYNTVTDSSICNCV